ncbi:acyltransferase family protein [Cryptosporangium sp. NPDC048952]|uniref:acyltransferase family protein n=1 Tax=Cryptosporangium sp. NPDC048952 TaxID=3363961 RepID=UPI00370FA096
MSIVVDRSPALRPHVAALDGLRGVAVLGVLLFHTGHLPGGFLGVDLFFALSGYLITDLLLREAAATGTVSPAAFWGRRVRRLLPALVLVLVGATLAAVAVGPPDLVRTTAADGPWVQANLVNWHLLAESASYWDRFGRARVFEHLWSIAVEEQFYLGWPLVVLVIARRSGRVARRVAVAAVGGSICSAILMIVLADPADPTRVYTGTDTRAFSLLLGAAVAAVPGIPERLAGPWSAALAAGLGTAWLVVDGADDQWLFTGGLLVHSLASAALIGACVRAPGSTVARLLAVPPLRWLGLISYSLYLWHWPVVVLLSTERTGLEGWTWTLLVGTVAIGLAVASKYLVEDPIRYRAGWARGRTGLLAFVVVMIGLAVLWRVVPQPPPVTIDVTHLS